MKLLTAYAFESSELGKKHPEVLKLAEVKDDGDILARVMARIYETISNWAKLNSVVADDDDFEIGVGIAKRPIETVKIAMKFDTVRPFTTKPFIFVFCDAEATEDTPNPFVNDLFEDAEPFVHTAEVGGDVPQIFNESDAMGHDIAVLFLHHLIPNNIKELIDDKCGEEIESLVKSHDEDKDDDVFIEMLFNMMDKTIKELREDEEDDDDS